MPSVGGDSGGDCWAKERRCSRSVSSRAVRAAKFERALGNGRLVSSLLALSASVMVQACVKPGSGHVWMVTSTGVRAQARDPPMVLL